MQNVQQIYQVAAYLRLSKDDREWTGGKKAESDSIKNQRKMILSYMQQQGDMELYDCYVDDGYSGSHFIRPGFQRMIQDMEAGKINCVIVKDLSRFGRDYIEAGRYIQRIFPAYHVRFIALNDCYDSLLAQRAETLIVVPVKNFINDAYGRDISLKVRSQLKEKRRRGEYLGAFPVYGYQRDPADRHHLMVDREAARIVRKIYSWKLDGFSANAIAGKLNGARILSPLEYKRRKGQAYQCGFVKTKEGCTWSSIAVKRILTNESYLGHLIQGKREKVNYKGKKVVEKPAEEWVRIEHMQEAVISAEIYEVVQNLLATDSRCLSNRREVNPFAGLLFCGECSEQMIRRVEGSLKKVSYICSTKNRGEGCSRHRIEEAVLLELVETILFRMSGARICRRRSVAILLRRLVIQESKKVQCYFYFRREGRNGKKVKAAGSQGEAGSGAIFSSGNLCQNFIESK